MIEVVQASDRERIKELPMTRTLFLTQAAEALRLAYLAS